MHSANSMLRENMSSSRSSTEWILASDKAPVHDGSVFGSLGKQVYSQGSMIQNYKGIHCKVSHCTLCGNAFAQSLFHKEPGRPSTSEKHCEPCRKELILRNYHRHHRNQPQQHLHSSHLQTNLPHLPQRVPQSNCCNSNTSRRNSSTSNSRNGSGDCDGLMAAPMSSSIPNKNTQDNTADNNSPTSSTLAASQPMLHATPSAKTITYPGRLFHCDICGRSFALIGNMQKHRKLHSGEKPFNCDVCGKAFGLRGNLQKHQIIHTGEKLFHCNVCGKAFTLRGNMEKHKIIHTGLKPYCCDICGKEFSLRGNLQKHKIIHISSDSGGRDNTGSNNKPFHCDICGKDFSQNHSLQNHMQRIHSADSSHASCPSP